MPPVLFLFLLLPEPEKPLLLLLALLAGTSFARQLALLMLERQRLLRFGADPGCLQLPAHFTLHPLGVARLFRQPGCLYRRAEAQAVKVAQDKLVELIFLWLCAEGHLTYLVLPCIAAFKDAGPEWFLEEHRQLGLRGFHNPSSFS